MNTQEENQRIALAEASLRLERDPVSVLKRTAILLAKTDHRVRAWIGTETAISEAVRTITLTTEQASSILDYWNNKVEGPLPELERVSKIAIPEWAGAGTGDESEYSIHIPGE